MFLSASEDIQQSVQLDHRIPVEEEVEEEIVLLDQVHMTCRQKWIVICLCAVDLIVYMSMSIIASFFPREAAEKGMRESVSSYVFSIYALVVFVTSPIFGKLIPTVGAKFMFLSGVGFCGSCNILFGLLDKVDGEVEFAVLCFVLRAFEALGASAFSTASCTMIFDQFPDDIGTVFGFTETCMAVGMSIGPVIGGGLYVVGGFGLPFFTLGGFAVLMVPLSWYLLRDVNDPEEVFKPSVSYKTLLSMPHVVVVCIILAFASQAHSFIEPFLEPHMRQYNLDTTMISWLFCGWSAAFAVSSYIVNWVSGKVENQYPMMVFGLILYTLAMLFLGPSVLLPIQGSLWLSIAALCFLGFFFAAVYVPTFEGILIAALNGGLENDVNTYSVVSGLWNSVYSLGEFGGPSLGGLLSEYLTFPQSSTVMAFITLIAFCFALMAWINPCLCFGPFCLIKDAEKKLASRRRRTPSQEELRPIQDGSGQFYGSFTEVDLNLNL